jgi:hypothetical protein
MSAAHVLRLENRQRAIKHPLSLFLPDPVDSRFDFRNGYATLNGSQTKFP